MDKTVKFSISMPAPEFRALESARRKAGRTRSQYIREAVPKVPAERTADAEALSVKEDHAPYGFPVPSDLVDTSELRQRAIAAAGSFESGIPDISIGHDRYLAEPAETGKDGKR